MPMSELTGFQRRIETLEDELRSALTRLGRLEARMAEEDLKVERLTRDVKREHDTLDRIEHGIPVGL